MSAKGTVSLKCPGRTKCGISTFVESPNEARRPWQRTCCHYKFKHWTYNYLSTPDGLCTTLDPNYEPRKSSIHALIFTGCTRTFGGQSGPQSSMIILVISATSTINYLTYANRGSDNFDHFQPNTGVDIQSRIPGLQDRWLSTFSLFFLRSCQANTV